MARAAERYIVGECASEYQALRAAVEPARAAWIAATAAERDYRDQLLQQLLTAQPSQEPVFAKRARTKLRRECS